MPDLEEAISDASGFRLERNIHTIIMTFVTMAIVWASHSVITLREDVITWNSELKSFTRHCEETDESLQKSINYLRTRMDVIASDRYRGRDAVKDFAIVDKELDALRRHMDKVEKHMEAKHSNGNGH